MTLQPLFALAWNPAVGIPLAILGLIVLALIWLFGEPRRQQGRRRLGEGVVPRREPTFGGGDDTGEPAVGDTDALEDAHRHNIAADPRGRPRQGELDVGLREELEKLGAALSGQRVEPAPLPLPGAAASIVEALRAPSLPDGATDAPGAASASAAPSPVPSAPVAAPSPMPPAAPRPAPHEDVGRRPPQMPMERIVTLYVVAREGHRFEGTDLIVAAEKAGLEFGHMGIYHRLIDGKREQGPIFSVANMLKPGSFDLGRLDQLRTTGLSFFMALPAPMPALDAWDAMLPTAQRMAELLDGQVLDEERNALGRQRIAHIRDELRGWDRDHEGQEIRFGR